MIVVSSFIGMSFLVCVSIFFSLFFVSSIYDPSMGPPPKNVKRNVKRNYEMSQMPEKRQDICLYLAISGYIRPYGCSASCDTLTPWIHRRPKMMTARQHRRNRRRKTNGRG